MNPLYIVGCLFIGVGAFCTYRAGRQDMRKEQEHDTWAKADEKESSE